MCTASDHAAAPAASGAPQLAALRSAAHACPWGEMGGGEQGCAACSGRPSRSGCCPAAGITVISGGITLMTPNAGFNSMFPGEGGSSPTHVAGATAPACSGCRLPAHCNHPVVRGSRHQLSPQLHLGCPPPPPAGITCYGLTLATNFTAIFTREWSLLHGLRSCSRRSCLNLLRRPGNAIILVPGGAAEALVSEPGTCDLLLGRRKGFVRVALLSGASLVPVFLFGGALPGWVGWGCAPGCGHAFPPCLAVPYPSLTGLASDRGMVASLCPQRRTCSLPRLWSRAAWAGGCSSGATSCWAARCRCVA